MIDTGATYSCIGQTGSKLPLSSSSVKTVGFSGKIQVTPLTQLVPMLIAGRTIVAPLLYSDSTPINLLGRDILCPLKANIMCTQDGLYVDFPEDPSARMMPVQTQREKTNQVQPLVYWLRLMPKSRLLQEWNTWKPWVQTQLEHAAEPQLPLHCTLLYDEQQKHKDYEECWEELINRKPCYMVSQDVYIGPQGAAAAVTLPTDLKDWFQVENSTPHVTLLVAKGHESHDLGPMVKAAMQVQEWKATKNKYIHISPDRQYI